MSGKDWSTTELSVLYDVFYECGTRLGGEYVSLAYAAEDAGDAEAVEFWNRQRRALRDERDAVDSHDREAIVTTMERWDNILELLRHARSTTRSVEAA
ncbi:MAG: hypothetical protein I3J03_07420 [Actinomyces succiniciruminis]|jgi:hypothetical protein|uniref:Uncharacterized protein n=1 Tax=Actinomyces glycerinitolerans TaxID=1892869 RepID=A0A1M4RYJ9_9ACTO|nr:hypothetical protein [Actinomyces glycerinitolerans]MBM6979531.1 hypothetical protein [Actinomyces succiniciruminis]SHE25028.1 Hypothetical protein ACGLYG10_1240 [Actinomyces glycerinitolerans]